MKVKTSYLILGFMAAIAAGAAMSLLVEESKFLVGIFALYALPFFITEEIYDTIEKRIAPWVNDGGHVVIALVLGAGFLVAWPFAVTYMVSTNFLFVRETLLYNRPFDLTPGLLGLPAYSWPFGYAAFLTAAGGYLFELGILWFIRKYARKGK